MVYNGGKESEMKTIDYLTKLALGFIACLLFVTMVLPYLIPYIARIL